MDGAQHLLEPWLQRLEHCPGAALSGELLRASPTPWQRLCSHLGGISSLPGLGLCAGSHSDTVNEGEAPCSPALALQKTEQGRRQQTQHPRGTAREEEVGT